jgi:hypothetical protein
VALFFGVVFGAGYALYYLFFKPAVPEVVTPTEPGQIQQLTGGAQGVPTGTVTPVTPVTPSMPTLPVTKIQAEQVTPIDTVAAGRVTKVYDMSFTKAESISLDSADNLRSYDPDSGKFTRLNADGEMEQLGMKVFKNVDNVSWSGATDEAILEFPDGTNVLYNFQTDKQITLPKDWTDFKFSGDSGKIAFKDMNADRDKRWLAIANPDGSGQKYLEPLGSKAADFHVNWSPDGTVVADYQSGKTGDTSSMFFVGQNGENFRSIDLNGYGVSSKWTPDSSKLLYSASNSNTSNKPELYIVDASGDSIGYNHNSLNLNTWADKCTFSDAETVYCAVPKEMPDGANLMPSIADNTADYIYKVNVRTGVKSFVAEPEYGFSIKDLTVASDESNIYFTDKQNGTLHTIKLQ